jgi:hypothetical protein
MSGQPCINPTDADTFRKAYLDTLQLQIMNNDINYQANKLHRRTGQVATQITDYRSTAEKMADVSSLKVLVKADLRKIMDEPNVERTMNDLSDDEVKYVARSMELITKELHPRYKLGVESPVFLSFVRALMKKDKSGLASVGGLASSSAPAVLDVAGIDEVEIKDQMDRIGMVLDILREVSRSGGAITELSEKLAQNLQILGGKLGHITSLLPSIEALSPAVQGTAKRMVMASINNAPNSDQLAEMAEALEKSRGSGERNVRQLLARMVDLTSHKDEDDELLRSATILIEGKDIIEREQEETKKVSRELGVAGQQLVDARRGLARVQQLYQEKNEEIRALTRALNRAESRGLNVEGLEKEIADLKGLLRQLDGEIKDREEELEDTYPVYLSDPQRFEITGERQDLIEVLLEYQSAGLDLENPEGQKILTSKSRKIPLSTITSDQARALYAHNLPLMVEMYKRGKTPQPPTRGQRQVELRGRSESVASSAIASALENVAQLSGRRNPQRADLDQPPASRTSVVGRGLSVAEDKGIRMKKVAPFGRYFINLSKLNDDIICLSTKNNTAVPSCRTLRVSVSVGNILRKMVNGRNPAYDDIQKLNEDDKREIHSLFKKAQIVMGEGMEIPKPVDIVEDLNRFNILKGEVLAGNDGKETIKAFKLLVLKLMNSGHLPKGQAKSLLVDLAEMGY